MLGNIRTYPSIGYRYWKISGLTEVSGTGMEAGPDKNTSIPGIVIRRILVLRVYLGGHTEGPEGPEVSGSGIERVPNTPVWFGI